MRALFRVDASEHIGSGHLFRCLSLAHALKDRGVSVVFASGPLPEKLAAMIIGADFELITIASAFRDSSSAEWDRPLARGEQIADASASLELAPAENDGWVIVDHYGLDEIWESTVRSRYRRVLVIDDLANRRHSCDLLLNANATVSDDHRYLSLANPECRVLLGPEYTLLREEFLQARRRALPRTGVINRVLVSFGGADPTGEAMKTVRALQDVTGLAGGIDVIGGAANSRNAELEEICSLDPRTRFHRMTHEMARLMSAADLSIGACGATSWERCALFLPTLAIMVSNNQREIARTLASAGAASVLGWHEKVTEKDLAKAVSKLCESPDRVRQMSIVAGGLVDGRGTERVVREMEDVYASARVLL